MVTYLDEAPMIAKRPKPKPPKPAPRPKPKPEPADPTWY